MFSQHFNQSNYVEKEYLQEDIENLLLKSHFTPHDLGALISDAASHYLEEIAQRASLLTKQRFGNTIQLFIPMYLSNICYNRCTYCGFSMDHDYPRVTLTKEEILKEAKILKEKGFDHILLLTGEAPKEVGIGYIKEAIKTISPHFSSIGIEVQPLSFADYQLAIHAGADSLTLYQETYHQEAYSKYHLSGKKKNYKNRLDALEAGAKAGFHRITIGSLLGLHNWRFEAWALAEHLDYLHKHYWKIKYGISFPRIQEMVGEFSPQDIVTDTHLAQLICAFRLIFPDLAITLSTREPAELRDHLIKLGITSISAESHTEPGGYSGKEAEQQFETSDKRSITEIKKMLELNGFEPVMKDWHGHH